MKNEKIGKTKKDKLRAIKNLFHRHKVLKLEDLSKVIGTTSRRTVHRYMKELEYLTSYSHKGQYYTLQEIANFDSDGLWHYDDIGFSKHGTLFNTITFLVDHSDVGMTSKELQVESHTQVKYALLDLIKDEKVTRIKLDKKYVYFSSDQAKAQKQQEKREYIPTVQAVDKDTTFRVLLAAYRFIENPPTPEQVTGYLNDKGSKISLEVVRNVFYRYDLEKKI